MPGGASSNSCVERADCSENSRLVAPENPRAASWFPNCRFCGQRNPVCVDFCGMGSARPLEREKTIVNCGVIERRRLPTHLIGRQSSKARQHHVRLRLRSARSKSSTAKHEFLPTQLRRGSGPRPRGQAGWRPSNRRPGRRRCALLAGRRTRVPGRESTMTMGLAPSRWQLLRNSISPGGASAYPDCPVGSSASAARGVPAEGRSCKIANSACLLPDRQFFFRGIVPARRRKKRPHGAPRLLDAAPAARARFSPAISQAGNIDVVGDMFKSRDESEC